MDKVLREDLVKKAAERISSLTGAIELKSVQVKMASRVLSEFVDDMNAGDDRDILSGLSQLLYDLDESFWDITSKIGHILYELEHGDPKQLDDAISKSVKEISEGLTQQGFPCDISQATKIMNGLLRSCMEGIEKDPALKDAILSNNFCIGTL